jgi:choline dehydrogenase
MYASRIPVCFLLLASCAESEHAAPVDTGEERALDGTCQGPGCAGGLSDDEFEYVVVGSGAGGGPLAARLARLGHRVLLLEAGGDPGDKLTYQIPAWHALASEDPAMRWDYFVEHYDDPAQAGRDDKRTPDGVWYPRGTGLGGSTSLNAMLAITPHASDWEKLAALTGNPGWNATAMRGMYERVDGWMATEVHLDDLVDYLVSAVDLKMLRVIVATIMQGGRELGAEMSTDWLKDVQALLSYVKSDVNAPTGGVNQEGVFRLPQQSEHGVRRGVRELVLDTIAAGHPLTLATRSLVTGVTFDRSGAVPRATGVEWLDGANLYDASPRAATSLGTPRSIRVTREVILAAGAFNTPQLLMLSGVGDADQLAAHGIETVVDLPGVGQNLQDRYEVGVIGEMSSWLGSQFRLLKDCTFDPSLTPAVLDKKDPCYVLWKQDAGVYTINGAVVGVVKKSRPELPAPDLFIFGLPGYFKGYWPGYSAETIASRTHFTWVVLKAHTDNKTGSVSLRSADPLERPSIDFRFFDGPGAHADLAALVDGVLFARRMVQRTKDLSPLFDGFREVYPGVEFGTREQLSGFIRDKAWGHHACCTAKVGADGDPMAVLDGELRVRGVTGLRVVDASVFPDIPGFFIAVPIYMVAEKAAELIHGSAQ